MKQLDRFVFYQTDTHIWVCQKDKRDEYCYYHEIKPIRLAILDVTQSGMEQLFAILACDRYQFTDIVNEMLNRSRETLYMN